MRIDVNAFHDHLDGCEQCREHPMNLCAKGVRLLYGEDYPVTPFGAHASDEVKAARREAEIMLKDRS